MRVRFPGYDQHDRLVWEYGTLIEKSGGFAIVRLDNGTEVRVLDDVEEVEEGAGR